HSPQDLAPCAVACRSLRVIPGRRTDLGFTRDRHHMYPSRLKPTWWRRARNPYSRTGDMDSGLAPSARPGMTGGESSRYASTSCTATRISSGRFLALSFCLSCEQALTTVL